jgi:hypothetical protein
LDGNVTVIIVAVILMGAFGPPDSLLAKLLTPVFLPVRALGGRPFIRSATRCWSACCSTS